MPQMAARPNMVETWGNKNHHTPSGMRASLLRLGADGGAKTLVAYSPTNGMASAKDRKPFRLHWSIIPYLRVPFPKRLKAIRLSHDRTNPLTDRFSGIGPTHGVSRIIG